MHPYDPVLPVDHRGEVEYMNPIKCGICPYYSALGTHCDAADKPAVKVNVCPQKRIRKAVKRRRNNP